MGLYWPKMAKRCQRDLKTTLILLKFAVNSEQMLWDYISSIHLLLEQTTLIVRKRECSKLFAKYFYLGTMLTDFWSKTLLNGKLAQVETLSLLRILKP